MNRRAVLRAAAAVAGSLLVGGCGGAPVEYDPTGVDQLEIPTPSPDPDDFVATVDNSWFPLAPGSRWVYESTTDRRTTTVTVSADPVDVAGVATTEVRSEVRSSSGKVVDERVDWYAQDDAGNVWYFGADAGDASWRAGVDGAEAGLVMPAEPRVGDGYRHQLAPDVVEEHATVLSLTEAINVPFDSYVDVLLTEDSDELAPERVEHRYYARDVGLVAVVGVSGGYDRLELVEFAAG
jgi:hypothetical protein